MRIGKAMNLLKLTFAKFKDDTVAKLEPTFMTIIDVLNRVGDGVRNILFL